MIKTMTKNILLIALGGGAGSVLRYLASSFTSKFFPSSFPWSTFLVNSLGCLLVGLLYGLFYKHSLTNPDLRFLFITGFCGGFTTFSAFSLENINLIQSNQVLTAMAYTLASIVVGFAFVWLGLSMTK